MTGAYGRTNIYIDGFNLYYGCLIGSDCKWLNLRALCEHVLPQNDINRIRYFTAGVRPTNDDPQKRQRQEAYIRALGTIPDFTVHYGRFLSHPRKMYLANPPPHGPRKVRVIRTEEKGSDVNLATYLLLDGFKGDYEAAVVLSNDSDLVEPIKIVRSEFNVPVGIVIPSKRKISQALLKVASFQRRIYPSALKDCQFPPLLHDEKGQIHKPNKW